MVMGVLVVVEVLLESGMVVVSAVLLDSGVIVGVVTGVCVLSGVLVTTGTVVEVSALLVVWAGFSPLHAVKTNVQISRTRQTSKVFFISFSPLKDVFLYVMSIFYFFIVAYLSVFVKREREISTRLKIRPYALAYGLILIM